MIISWIGSTKFGINFMTPGVGVFVLGRGHNSNIVYMLYVFEIFFSTAEHKSNKL